MSLVVVRGLNLYLITAQLHEPLPDGAVIHIVPRLAGAKHGGIFQTILGAVVVAVAWWNPAGWLGAAALTGMYAAGASMILGGIAQMLTPAIKTPSMESADNGKQNTFFSSLDNMIAQGNPLTESHLGKELLEKVELTEDNASRLEEFSKEWKDANDKWNAMWAVKIEQTKDGKHYVAGIGLSMEDTEEGKLSQFLVAANRIAFIDPANGNETPMFVAQGNQIFMNDVFLKRLTAPTITSGGNPPAFSLTPDGKLTAKNADISGSVNANSGTLSNVTIAENCTINGTLRAEKIVGDIVKAASAAFPRQRESSVDWPSGTRTVTVTDDHPFDRQIVVLPLTFRGSKRTVSGRTTYSMCYLKVLMNGAVIYDGAANEAVQVFSRIVDMPAGRGNVILTFTLTSTRHSADIPPDTFASDVQVMVIKKQALGISVV